MQAHEYLKSYLKTNDFTLEKLAGDASKRIYYRVQHPTSHTYVLMDYSNETNSGKDFIQVQDLLVSNKINCPRVIHHNKDDQLILLEDLTDKTLEDLFFENRYLDAYKQALDTICALHAIQPDSQELVSQRAFDYEKLYWECEFSLRHLNKLFERDDLDALSELSEICQYLHELPRVICHRDFHSRNIMIKEQSVFLIDFQDARMGPWQYDVVSLLHDTYVNLTDAEKRELLQYYTDRVPFKLENNWQQGYQLQSIQRTLKACGSFASLKNNKNTTKYLQYLPKAFHLLLSLSEKNSKLHKYISQLVHSDKGIIA